MEEIVDDTLRTLVSGGYFYPEGFCWLRDNWAVSNDGRRLVLSRAITEIAQSIYGGPQTASDT